MLGNEGVSDPRMGRFRNAWGWGEEGCCEVGEGVSKLQKEKETVHMHVGG